MNQPGKKGEAGVTTLLLILHGLVGVALPGALIYPAYRMDIRMSFEDMGLAWAAGLFETKEQPPASASACCRSIWSCGDLRRATRMSSTGA